MKARFLGFAVLMLCVSGTAAGAVTFPDVYSAEPFSGTFTINPTTPDTLPSSCGFCYGGTGVRPSAIGTMTVQLAGNTFSGPIDAIFVVPGTDSSWRWDLQSSDTVTLNGAPLFINSAMSIQLYGSAVSTSILPLAFAHYTLGIFQIQALAVDLKSGASYYGPLNSLIQVDAAANFTFSGIIDISNSNYWITDATGHAVVIPFTATPPAATPIPAALPLFATGLGAMGLLGWRRKRKAAA